MDDSGKDDLFFEGPAGFPLQGQDRLTDNQQLAPEHAVGPILVGDDPVRRVGLDPLGQGIRKRVLDPPAEGAIVEHLHVDAPNVVREQGLV